MNPPATWTIEHAIALGFNYKPAVYDYPRGPVATIAASRGCPFHCKFCDTSTFGAKVRYYSPKKVFEMMVFLQKKWGIRHSMFWTTCSWPAGSGRRNYAT